LPRQARDKSRKLKKKAVLLSDEEAEQGGILAFILAVKPAEPAEPGAGADAAGAPLRYILSFDHRAGT
jgi:hypothetical protein